MRERLPLGIYNRPMPIALWWSFEIGCCLMSEVPLYTTKPECLSCYMAWWESIRGRGALQGHLAQQKAPPFRTLQ